MISLLALGFVLGVAVIALAVACLNAPPLRERAAYRYVVAVVAAFVASVPLGVAGTIALLPVWSWLEEATGIESVGHSGPAGWCYLVTYSIAVVILGCAGLLLARRGGAVG